MSDDPKPKKNETVQGLIGMVMLAAISYGIWNLASGPSEPQAETVAQAVPEAPATAPAEAAPEPELAKPAELILTPEQVAFQAAIVSARDTYDNAANDLARGGARPARGEAICGAVEGRKIEGWVGTVYNLTTNGDGKGVLSIEVPGEAWLSTWNNALSDTGSNTLIDPKSPLFASLSKLAEGHQVTFSGSFIADRSGVDCFQEQSMTMDGSILQPEFVFVFSSVEPIN